MVNGLNIIGSNKALQDHWVKRVLAYIIDWIILVIISILLTLVLAPTVWFGGGVGSIFFGAGLFLYALIAILYWVIQEGFMGGTVGKKIMGLRVVGTHGPVDIVKAVIRNVSKIHGILLLLDWIAGLATEGDPRQKFTDRFAGTTVVRTDPQAYVEEQFRQMATPPPHPAAPVAGWGGAPPSGQAPPQAWPGQQAPPPGSAPAQQPPAQGQQWPGQPPAQGQAGWPQHQWNEQGQLVQQARFCAACGGPLVPRGDGRLVCSRCGAVY
ncbi:MAG TPA: RDD family protein [Thermoplasmata archaeon]|nr:RDD family protein [Thermoplasmata archaeon]